MSQSASCLLIQRVATEPTKDYGMLPFVNMWGWIYSGSAKCGDRRHAPTEDRNVCAGIYFARLSEAYETSRCLSDSKCSDQLVSCCISKMKRSRMNLVTKFIGKILAGTLVVIFLIAIIGLAILPKVSNAISDSLEDKTAEIEEQVRSEIEIQILSIEKQIDSLTDEIELKIVDRTEALEIRVISQMSYETKRILREIELLKIG